jgi:hypothetical protein
VTFFRLDPKTETPETQANRTDGRFFHGMEILRTEEIFDQRLRDQIADLITRARTRGQPPLVRDGEYGIRLVLGTTKQDVIICFACRSPSIRLVGGAIDDERELSITRREQQSLREVLAGVFRK